MIKHWQPGSEVWHNKEKYKLSSIIQLTNGSYSVTLVGPRIVTLIDPPFTQWGSPWQT